MNQDQLFAETGKINPKRRPYRRNWTLADLPRDQAFRLAYNPVANRWDLALLGPSADLSFSDEFTTE